MLLNMDEQDCNNRNTTFKASEKDLQQINEELDIGVLSKKIL
jgi:hypothetical protein